MIVKFSRHARRRAKLYEIQETAIIRILGTLNLKRGDNEFIKKVPGHDLPIKRVVNVENLVATVITVYPLKKRKKRDENLLR